MPTAAPPGNSYADNIAVTSRWQVDGRRAQRSVADAAMARWRQSPWPEGCLSVTCLLSTDGRLVLFYGQWTDEQSYQRHVTSLDQPATADRVDGLEPGVTHLDTVVTRPAGPPVSRTADGPFSGCVVLVTIATDGPDQQLKAAEMITTVAATPEPGAIGGQIRFSLDGARLVLYAEWTSEEAHGEAITGSTFGGPQGIFHGTPGIQGLSMHRYQLYRLATR
ncbi:hypothetical protein GCM10027280_36390 [Micromonospora polyrhachis]|uniref:Quinol monooxygenase YgiN n=1 Tax=Micromonospora polyrhachis TaxID=1282883 RepID=A0A7W7SPV5_9ACTN|nr:antibiotic biosynthesis monooxygenase [Micromonospora polyrhachis]MBB4958753.1 quinol monooxygenase YgiN [Micromonospora polyrhachis]